MASPMRSLASAFSRRLVGPQASALSLRGGAGARLGFGRPPASELPESDELTWYDGTPNPEPATDAILPNLPSNTALQWLAAGLSVFALVGLAAVVNDKPSRIPWAPREFPFDDGLPECTKDQLPA
ncbi:hypothetical protein CLOM_g19895 [Closterium sp. NIES-68]|nr:hypothetical protein CLOM_g19895 [Closterium sp. NIES-68]GJP86847.1 hypothetical protein CLOP_g16822 [Closterium sp. NIES-67]